MESTKLLYSNTSILPLLRHFSKNSFLGKNFNYLWLVVKWSMVDLEKHWSRRILESMEYVSCLIPNCYSSFTQFTHTYITLNIIRIKMAISAQTTATASYKLSLANVWAQWPKTNNFIQDSRIIFAKCWVHYRIQKHHPYKMSNIKFVQSCWNFAQLRKLKNKQVAKIWSH